MVARRVGQLIFPDFLAAVNLSEDTANAGNNQLRPPQSWEAELEVSRNFGTWGSATVRLFQVRRQSPREVETLLLLLFGAEARS